MFASIGGVRPYLHGTQPSASVTRNRNSRDTFARVSGETGGNLEGTALQIIHHELGA